MLKENRNKEQVQIELLDITRDLMTLMGLNPLTTDLNKMKDLLLRFIYKSEIWEKFIEKKAVLLGWLFFDTSKTE